jgi:hypothetical protein
MEFISLSLSLSLFKNTTPERRYLELSRFHGVFVKKFFSEITRLQMMHQVASRGYGAPCLGQSET